MSLYRGFSSSSIENLIVISAVDEKISLVTTDTANAPCRNWGNLSDRRWRNSPMYSVACVTTSLSSVGGQPTQPGKLYTRNTTRSQYSPATKRLRANPALSNNTFSLLNLP